jgi:hypothetical protein
MFADLFPIAYILPSHDLLERAFGDLDKFA